MSNGTFNRPRRQFEPRAYDERGREYGEHQSRGPDQGVPDQGDPGVDALEELARLIGHTDPYAPPAQGRANDAGRPDGRIGGVPRGLEAPDRGAADRAAFPGGPSDYAAPQERSQELSQDRPYAGRPADDRASRDETARDLHLPDFMRRDPPTSLSRLPVQSPRQDPDRAAMRPAAGESNFSHPPGRDEYPVAPEQTPVDGGDYAGRDGEHGADARAVRQHPAYGQRYEEYDEHDAEDEYGHEGEYEDEHPDDDDDAGVKRRGSVKIAIAVLLFGVFGGAAAYSYRTVYKADSSGPTPVIHADNSPTKVMPVGGDAKPISERLGERSDERLVRRDEDPVDVGATYGSGAVGAAGSFPGAADSPPPGTVSAANSPAALTEPKSIRTVPIKADQGGAAADRALSPPPRAAAPPRQAVAPRAAETGGFVVQLSALKSEADAQASFRTLQSKYSVLNGRQPLIRRKDQGDRGVFFAAQVGPFSVKSEADQLCESLKSAGGSCFVLRN